MERIQVVAIGDVEPMLLKSVCSAVTEVLGNECRVGKGVPIPEFAYNQSRQQHSADALLNALPAESGQRMLGIADRDLYVPELNFVFGLADPRTRRAVIALPRLREEFYNRPENRVLYFDRAAKEALHELGHTFGLPHCSDRHCVMSFSNTLADTDYKSKQFCEACQSAVRGK